MESATLKLGEESMKILQKRRHDFWEELRLIPESCDAKLETEDSTSVLVHKSVMAVSSTYFYALFTSPISAQPRYQYTIPGVSGDALRALVDFAYGKEEAILTMDNILTVLPAADQFNFLDLLDLCSNFLVDRLDCENCIGFLQFARSYFVFDLEKKALSYLLNNFVEVSEKSQEYLQLPLEELTPVLGSDRINVRNEEAVWEAGLRWIDHAPDERRCHVHRILQCVRLGLLDTEYFMEKVKVHNYVENVEECKPIIMQTLRFLWDLESIGEMTESVETPFLAIPRIPYAVLFTIGGWSGGQATALIETYDTKADRWIRIAEIDTEGPRAYHKLAVIGHDIYVIGGFDGNKYFNSCRRFNAYTKQWSPVAPMHSKRCYVSVAVLNNQIYALGGYDGYNRQNTVERYDNHRNQWFEVAPMHVQRSDACATTLGGLLYIVGGFNGTECLSSCECYDPATDQWALLPPMRQRRSGVSVIAHHGSIYAIGGFNGISRLTTGESYNPQTREWTSIAEMFHPRSNFAVEVMDDMIFVMGGFNGVTTILHVECFDDRNNEWYEATDMNAYRSALAACVVPGLPNVDDYIHQNRRGLMEEKRQKLLQQRALEEERRMQQISIEVDEEEEDDEESLEQPPPASVE